MILGGTCVCDEGDESVIEVLEVRRQLTRFPPRTRERCPCKELDGRLPRPFQYADIPGEGQRERCSHSFCWMHRAVLAQYSLVR